MLSSDGNGDGLKLSIDINWDEVNQRSDGNRDGLKLTVMETEMG